MFDRVFYKNKKILLTGHTGFKGTWLSLMLESMDSIVYGFALDGSENTPFYKETTPKVAGYETGFIQDKSKIQNYVKKVSPEIIIHLASHSTLNESDKITDYIFESNVNGVVNLLEAVRNTSSVKAVLIVTSDKCYKNVESDLGYVETSELGAQDPYSTSKACQELITECYRKSFFSKNSLNVPIASARASNVVGGGDYNLSRLFPYLLNSFSEKKIAHIRNPKSIRPWQNVLDVLGGYLTLVQKMYESDDGDSVYASAFNFGPEKDGFVTVEQVAGLLADEFNMNYEVGKTEGNVIETKILKLDNTKSKEILGWSPLFSFQQTIKMSAEFKKRQMNGESTRNIACDFIERYLKLCQR